MTPIAARPASTTPPDRPEAARGRTQAAEPADSGFAGALEAAAASSEPADAGQPDPRAAAAAVAESGASADAAPLMGQALVADAASRLDSWNAWLIWSGHGAQEGLWAEPAVDASDASDTPPADDDAEVGVAAGIDTDAMVTGVAGPLAGAVPVPMISTPGSHGDPQGESGDAPLPAPADVLDTPQTTALDGAARPPSGSVPSPALATRVAGEATAPLNTTSAAPEAHATAKVSVGTGGAVTPAFDVPSQPPATAPHALAADPPDAHASVAVGRTLQGAPGVRDVDPSLVVLTEPPVGFVPGAVVVAPVALAPPAEATAMAVPLEQAAGADTASAVVDQIVKSLRMQWKQGVGEARIQLRPEHLGPVDISLKVEAGAVTAIVRAESAQVQEWMLGNQQSLRQQLEAAGLRLDDLVVSRDAERRRERGAETPANRRNAPRRRREGESEPLFNVVV